MKKIFAAVFSMALVFGLAGCGSQSSESASAPQQVEGQTDEASVARARELMDGLMSASPVDNVTEVAAVTTITEMDGETYSNTVTTTTMKDVTDGNPHFYIKTETDPASESDAAYYVDGTEGAKVVGDEVASLTYDQSYIDSLMNPEDTSDEYRTYYDCAETIAYYEKDGVEVVNIQVDPAKLMESGLLSSTFSNIESCVAEYTFNADGKISIFLSTIKGAMKGNDGTDVEAAVDARCVFTDYGTTEIPETPVSTIDDQLAALDAE